MHVKNIKSADHPRRRLSLRYTEIPTRPQPQSTASLPRNELRRIVAEMVG